MAEMTLQAMFGGTFDPVHFGHLKSVETLAELTGLSRVIIMPNNIPPHRAQPEASSEQRKKMLGLAIAGNPLFVLDPRELERPSPSYTIHTLRLWRAEQGPDRPLAFIIGQDALLTFPDWRDHEKILATTHLIVCRRPGYPLRMKKQAHQQWLEQHLTHSADALHTLACGKIYLAQTPWLNISATLIRQQLKKGEPCHHLLPAKVLEYINQQGLYR